MPLGTEEMGTQLPLAERGTAITFTFRPMFVVVKRSPISATAELLLFKQSIFHDVACPEDLAVTAPDLHIWSRVL